jgi:hypothetical protein
MKFIYVEFQMIYKLRDGNILHPEFLIPYNASYL